MELMAPARGLHLGTRRGFLFSLAAPVVGERGRIAASERVRYLDGATDFEMDRLTDPAKSSCYLPPTHNTIFLRKSHLCYLSDRSGAPEVWSLDLKTYQSRQMTECKALDPRSIAITQDERSLCYIDDGVLHVAPVAGGKGREVYKLDGASTGAGASVTGVTALVAEATRLRLVSLVKGAPVTIAESKDPITDPMPRPKRASALYRSGGGLWLAHLDGQRNVKLKLPPGRVGPARWSADGRTVVYLSYPEQMGRPNALREHTPDTGEDRLIANTSQFVAFGSNVDGSVFVAASGSKAGPYVLLFVRSVKRELTICEHKSSDPATTAPLFSPDSQRIFFQSDRQGKPALYSVDVRKFVERTDT